MLKVGIIGLGNAGNQVAELAKKTKGIQGVAINTSSKDITNISSIDTIVIGDEKGAGKDRKIAKKFIAEKLNDFIEQEVLLNLIKDNEVLFIVSSTGGGSGSGTAPLLYHILKQKYSKDNKHFIIVDIYPALKESLAAQQNTIDYLKERLQSNPTYMSYDNQRKAHLPSSLMMQAINEEIVEDISILRGDYQYSTPFTSIDEKDSLKIFTTPGRLQVGKLFGVKEKDLDNKSIEELLIFNIKNNASITELQRNRIIKRLGVITNLNKKLNSMIDSNLTLFKEFIGEPVEGFEHIVVNEKDDDINRLIVFMSGLSVPDDRIEKIVQRIEEIKEELLRQTSSTILDELKTEDINALRNDGDTPNEIDLTDILNQYM